MRCLIIDNYDSFTWNLADYAARAFGSEPLVVRNDQFTWRELIALHAFGCIIVSPGPGTVTNPDDVGISKEALEQNDVPVLGVCLGHQGLAYFHGGKIIHAPVPFHGRLSTIYHDGSRLFEGLPPSFEAVRYHSLVVCPESIPPALLVTARTISGLVMGLKHVSRPKWGVQFHPESVLTSHGMRIISNFREEVGRQAAGRRPLVTGSRTAKSVATKLTRSARSPESLRQHQVFSTRVTGLPLDSAHVFRHLYADQEHCFWLDSQSGVRNEGRFSFMGHAADGAEATCEVRDPASESVIARHLTELEEALGGCVSNGGAELPFEFRGGYVGYLSYEAKEGFGATTTHKTGFSCSVWLRAERFLAFDHLTGDVWLVAIAALADEAGALTWLEETSARLKSLPHFEHRPQPLGRSAISVALDFGRAEYLAAVAEIQRKIVDGEAYEICLTNHFRIELELDPLELYLGMRATNPAPFGAFIKVGNHRVLSTSPERFVKVDARGTVQTKPIKGTCARSDDPATDQGNAAGLAASEKERAENLMIVDLLRNDLTRVSVPGSIRVTKLMDVESFQTVHHLVSTIESTLKAECGLVDLLRAAFPGGSVTGAPKRRAMEIIDDIERSPRGIYCGAIGYLGYNRVADLNVAIRTLSYDGTTMEFGAGGAVTSLSDPETEFQEMLLKAEVILGAIWRYVNGSDAPFKYQLHGTSLCVEANSHTSFYRALSVAGTE